MDKRFVGKTVQNLIYRFKYERTYKTRKTKASVNGKNSILKRKCYTKEKIPNNQKPFVSLSPP